MTIRPHIKLSPECLITLPRRSPAVPNPDGRYALYNVTTYSLETHTDSTEIKVLNLETEESTLFSDDQNNFGPQWLVRNQVLWLRRGAGGKTELWVGSVGTDSKNAYRAGEIDAQIKNVIIKELPDGSIALGFTALMNDDGSLHNSEKAEKPVSTAREYETIYVRHWDSYFSKERGTFWYTSLIKVNGTYRLSSSPVINALEGTDIDFPCGPSDADALDGEVQLSTDGILLSCQDPELNPAKKVSAAVWYLSVPSFLSAPESIRKINVPGFYGSTSGLSFSPDGNSAAFLKTKSLTGDFDYNRIFVLDQIKERSHLVEVNPIRDETKQDSWDLSPSSTFWSNDGTELYVKAEDRAQHKLWKICIQKIGEDLSMESLTVVATAFPGIDGSVHAAFPLTRDVKNTRLLITKSSMINNSMFCVVDPSTGTLNIFKKMNSAEVNLGLKRSQLSEINFQGGGDYQVHAWVFKPSNFDPDKKYPLAFAVHGGPAGAWPDVWSARWNLAIWAEQGYVVVAPNPTGSTGFGTAFAAAVKGEWGGRPYDDLVQCFTYIEQNMPYVDTTRAVASGGSYGGYMMNWIAGQPLAHKFKTLICHDGVFDFRGMLGSDVPTSIDEQMGAHAWDDSALWDRYDPSRFTQNWVTPMLVIHSDRDYRCPVSQGLAPFYVCQMKGIPSRFLNFPDENHIVERSANSLKWYRTVLGWANKYADVQDGVKLEPPVSEPRPKIRGVLARR